MKRRKKPEMSSECRCFESFNLIYFMWTSSTTTPLPLHGFDFGSQSNRIRIHSMMLGLAWLSQRRQARQELELEEA